MRRRLASLFALGLAALALAGCDSTLWDRYQAERAFWQARREVDRIEINPRLASPADFDRAIARFQSIVDHWPASRWATPERLADSTSRDVAVISGDALIAIGRLEFERGHLDRAVAVYGRAATDYRALLPVRLEATLGRCTALEHGDPAAALEAFTGLARDFPIIDPSNDQVIQPVVLAPLRVAGNLLAAGRVAASDSVLRDAERRYLEALARERGKAAAPDLWLALARARASRGRADQLEPALMALRGALGEPRLGKREPEVVVTLAEYCLKGGRPDSALTYIAWAERYPDPVRPQAMMMEAQAWEQKGVTDSAVAAYGRFLDAYPGAFMPGEFARYHRGVILEKAGRWEEARTEYRALIALDPASELALGALENIVRHHLDHGEKDLAQIEANRGVESLDHTLATNHDEAVLLRARTTRARLLIATQDWTRACAALTELWSHYGQMPLGVSAGFEAAALAESHLGDKARAMNLYRDLAERATRADDQRRARAQLARLERGEATPRS